MSEYGFVYILCNGAMNGYYKIGATRRPPSLRCAELSCASGVPYPFETFMYGETINPFALEALIHEHFAAHRANPDREFFMLGVDELDELIDMLRAECSICAYGDGYDMFAYFKQRAKDQAEEAVAASQGVHQG